MNCTVPELPFFIFHFFRTILSYSTITTVLYITRTVHCMIQLLFYYDTVSISAPTTTKLETSLAGTHHVAFIPTTLSHRSRTHRSFSNPAPMLTIAPDFANREYDVIVVGAGVAGASLATSLARDGRSVLCIERHLYNPNTETLAEPSRIVGELLQPGGFEKLRQLGLAAAVEGIDAVPIYGYGIFLDSRAQCIPYSPPPLSKTTAGRSFHNGRFLRRLREIACEHSNITLVEGAVTALDEADDGRVIGVSVRLSDGSHVHPRARLTVACDGCSSSLRRRAADVSSVSVYSNFHGLLLEMTDIPFPQHGHVILAHPTPVLFYPVSSTHVRCLVDVSSSFRGDVSEYMLSHIAPQIPKAFRIPFEHAVRSGQSRMMPNRVMPAPAQTRRGAILLGDAFNMRHPLTGGGMTVALSDISILRDCLRPIDDLRDDDAVSVAMQLFREQRKPLSTTINILANALYTLFCAPDPALQEMRDACFIYITSGGRMTHDPMGMLGGLKPQRFLLVTHFFAVALYGCGRALLPFPTISRICRAWDIFRASFNVIKPLIDSESLAPLSWIPVTVL